MVVAMCAVGVAMRYLIRAGDAHFRHFTLEPHSLAGLRVVAVHHHFVFGDIRHRV